MSTAALTFVGWLIAGASFTTRSSPPSPCSSLPVPARWRWRSPPCRWWLRARLFRSGIILNAGDAIERLAEVDTVVFDKTGTLTLPDPASINGAYRCRSAANGGAACSVEPASAGGGAGAARTRARSLDGAVEEPGSGVRAMIDGIEARLGSATFCGADRHAQRQRRATAKRRSSLSLTPGPSAVDPDPADICGPMRGDVMQSLERAGSIA